MDQSTGAGDIDVALVVDSDLSIGTASPDVNSLHSVRLVNGPRAIQRQYLKTRIGRMHHDSIKQPIRGECNSAKFVVLEQRRNRERAQESSVGTVFNDTGRIAECPSAIDMPGSKCET